MRSVLAPQPADVCPLPRLTAWPLVTAVYPLRGVLQRVMLGEMLDTSPEAQRRYFERLAQLTPSARLALMRESSRMIRQIAEAAIHRDYPHASPGEVRARLAVRLYGRDVVEPVLGPLPDDMR